MPWDIIMWVLSGLSAGTSLYAGHEEEKAAEAQAYESERVGKEKSKQVQEKGRRVRGQQRAGFGAAQVDTSTGTPMEVVLETLSAQIREDESVLKSAKTEAEAYRRRGRLARYGSYGDAAGAFGYPVGNSIETTD